MKVRSISAFAAGMLFCFGTLLDCSFSLAWLAAEMGLIQVYSPDPNRRMNELLNNSEDLRAIEYEWERIWFEDKEQMSAEKAGWERTGPEGAEKAGRFGEKAATSFGPEA